MANNQKFPSLTGQRFGRLLVKERGPNGGKNVRYAVICDCGTEKLVFASALRGTTKSCGCLRRECSNDWGTSSCHEIPVETKFGKLTVIGKSNLRKHGAVYWDCQCDCGSKSTVKGTNLFIGVTRSCGCLRRTDENLAFTAVLAGYKSSARKRGVKFLLIEADFRQLIESPCCYCGIEPHTTRIRNGDSYTYSGIDRVDSAGDYVPQNCAPCCATCNRAKLTMSKAEFLCWVERIYEHNFS